MTKWNIFQNLFQNGHTQNGSSEKGLKRIPPLLPERIMCVSYCWAYYIHLPWKIDAHISLRPIAEVNQGGGGGYLPSSATYYTGVCVCVWQFWDWRFPFPVSCLCQLPPVSFPPPRAHVKRVEHQSSCKQRNQSSCKQRKQRSCKQWNWRSCKSCSHSSCKCETKRSCKSGAGDRVNSVVRDHVNQLYACFQNVWVPNGFLISLLLASLWFF